VLQISESYIIPADHPCLAGHFPDAPIVPGVVLLDYARALLQIWQPGLRIKTLSQAKFLQPLPPQQAFTITLTADNADKIKFACVSETQKLLSGTFIMENKA
jgi:3-hydroxymyristoyl/3-hydroxydecanoyl-(acyl carrier protein) dehydratase